MEFVKDRKDLQRYVFATEKGVYFTLGYKELTQAINVIKLKRDSTMEIIPYRIEKNGDYDSYCIIENPEAKNYGTSGLHGDKVVRSPFDTPQEAQDRMHEIAFNYGYEVQLQNPEILEGE